MCKAVWIAFLKILCISQSGILYGTRADYSSKDCLNPNEEKCNVPSLLRIPLARDQSRQDLESGPDESLENVINVDLEMVRNRVRRQSANNTISGNGLVGHRPSFNVNAQSDPYIWNSLNQLGLLSPLDTSFGVHRVALLNTPSTIQELEAALQAAWWNANIGTKAQGLSQAALSVRVIQFQDVGLFSDQGLPVVEAVYAVGVNHTLVPAAFRSAAVTIRLPDIQTLTNQLQNRAMQICDCDVYRGRFMHLIGIVTVASNLTQFQQALQNAWTAAASQLRCGNCRVSVKMARTVITVGGTGVRLTTVPYIVLLNGRVWAGSQVLDPAAAEAALSNVGLQVAEYRGVQAPIYAALAFVNYLNANIQFQDLPAVQRSVQSNFDARLAQPAIQATVWNLEPFLDPQANIVTQSSCFLSLPNGETLDPRLFYSPPLAAVLANQTEGNVSTVTGETLGIHPVYLYGQIQADQLRSMAEILKITYAELNTGKVNPDDVQVAVVSLEDGVAPSLDPRNGPVSRTTELHVSAMVGGVDPERLPELTKFHQMLASADSQDAMDNRLSSFGTSVCRNCQFRKLRLLYLLQVDPQTSSIPDAQAVLDKVLAAWIAANPESPWLPYSLTLAGRDDALANENGTLVSQLSYSVGYPLPSFNWYIPRDPSNETLEQQLALIKGVPFFGQVIAPQRISLSKQMSSADQALFAAAAMRAWAEDKDDLRPCLQPDANCFVAVVDADNPVVSNVNGNSQYLYKYFVLVNDKVYQSSSGLSGAGSAKLRTAMDATVAAPNVPANSAVVNINTTPSPDGTSEAPVAPVAIPGQFNLTDNINIAVNSESQRMATMNSIKKVWAVVLAENATNVDLVTLRDQPGFPNPSTPDGMTPIRTVTYQVTATPRNGALINLQAAVLRFQQLLPGANIEPVLIANPNMAANSVMRIIFGTTEINATAIPFPGLIGTGFATEESVTLATTEAATVIVVNPGPSRLQALPAVVGPFVIPDTVAVTADTRRQRDRVFEEQVKPLWLQALGDNVTAVRINVVRDSAYPNQAQSDGLSVRQVDYEVTGTTNGLDTQAARDRFHLLAMTAGLGNVYAVQDQNGVLVHPSGATVVIVPVTSTTTTTTTTPTRAVLVPVAAVIRPVAPAQPEFIPRLESNLLFKNYSPSDEEAIAQTLDQLWSTALGTNSTDVRIVYLNSSEPTNITTTDGNTVFNYHYQLQTRPNVTDAVAAWPLFVAQLTQSDINDLLEEQPAAAPPPSLVILSVPANSTVVIVGGATTTLRPVIGAIPVVNVLSFTENQEVAVPDSLPVAVISAGLGKLWADAAGIDQSGSEVRIQRVLPVDPPAVAPNGIPVNIMTYGVTLQNVSDLQAVRARAEILKPQSSIAQYLVFSTVTLSVTTEATTTLEAIPLPVVTPVPTPFSTHSIDLVLLPTTNLADVQGELGVLWAQAFNLPQDQVNVSIQSTQPVSSNSPVSRVLYNLAVNGRNETNDTDRTFAILLLQSPLATLLPPPATTQSPLAPQSRTNHTLPVAVTTPEQLDMLTNGIRTTWITVLGLEATPQDVNLTLTDAQPTNVATAAGIPVRTFSYELGVPQSVTVGPAEEARFLALIYQSPVNAYLPNITLSGFANVTQSATPVAPVWVPFTIDDSALITANTPARRDRIMATVNSAWINVLGNNVRNVNTHFTKDSLAVPPSTPEGGPLRNVEYQVAGESNGPLDADYAKWRFRQALLIAPAAGVYNVTFMAEPATTTTSATTETVFIISTSILPETTTTASETLLIPPIGPILPLSVAENTTTVQPVLSTVRFLRLLRPVGVLDQQALADLIARTWAQENNVSVDAVHVNITSFTPIVDDKGTPGANVTYTLTGPASLTPPTPATEDAILTQAGWPICHSCFTMPVYRFYVTFTDADADVLAPGPLRDTLKRAVQSANPDIPAAALQAGIPRNMAPKEAEMATIDGRRLMEVDYFPAAVDSSRMTLQNVQPAGLPDLQAQFPGRQVFFDGDAELIKPVILYVQRNAQSWVDQPPKELDALNSVQIAVDDAVKKTAQDWNFTCNACTGKVYYTKELWGPLGVKYYALHLVPVNIENAGSRYPPDKVIEELAKETSLRVNNLSAPVEAVSQNVLTKLAVDPKMVYYYDFPGTPSIFNISGAKDQFLSVWRSINPACQPTGKVECNFGGRMMHTEKRVALADNQSRVTRVYFTITSDSPYIAMPSQDQVQSPDALPSRPIITVRTDLRQISSDSRPTSSVQAARRRRQALIENSTETPDILEFSTTPAIRLVTVITNIDAVQVQVQGQPINPPTAIAQAPLIDSSNGATIIPDSDNENERFCYDPSTDQYQAYHSVDKVFDRQSQASVAVTDVITTQLETCRTCVCYIRPHRLLLKGDYERDQENSTLQAIKAAWLYKYGNVSQTFSSITPDQWQIYRPRHFNHRFTDENNQPLSLVIYGLLVAGGPPDDLLMTVPESSEYTTAFAANNASLTVCDGCDVRLNGSFLLANWPANASTSALNQPLADAWSQANPDVAPVAVSGAAFGSGLYTVHTSNNDTTQARPVFYTVTLPGSTRWKLLETVTEPTIPNLSRSFATTIGPNVTAYPMARSQPLVPQSQPGFVPSTLPDWLPAAIIVPLAGAIALVLIIVCLITRASRIFRSRKTVIITDPGMIQSVHESPFKEGNGKSNNGFDEYHDARHAARQDISKV